MLILIILIIFSNIVHVGNPLLNHIRSKSLKRFLKLKNIFKKDVELKIQRLLKGSTSTSLMFKRIQETFGIVFSCEATL